MSDDSLGFALGLMRDQVCVITGGGTGIGLSTAKLLLTLGARLALFGRREDVVRSAAQGLDGKGERVLAQRCDIREPAEVEQAVAATLQKFGAIDVLVNNAGGQFPAPAEAISPRGFEAVVRNNLYGTWN